MRTPGGRVVLVALAAAGVLVAGTLATRHGPIGGGGGDAAHAASTAAATGRTTGLVGLGSLSDRLARLPEVRLGELHGTLLALDDACRSEQLALASLRATIPTEGVCAVPGAAFGISADGDAAPPGALQVLDLHGRPTELIRVPAGMPNIQIRRDGVVFCTPFQSTGRLRRFGGGTEMLPSCPLGPGEPMLFPGPGRRSIVDRRGRRVAALRTQLTPSTLVRTIGDGVVAVDTAIYRGGRRLATFDEPGGIVLGASRDGRVAMIGNGTGLGLVLYRDGVAHPLDTALATHIGTVSPDGSRLLVQHGGRQLIELDTATLRPLAQLHLTLDAELLDWLPADG
jgi:hypothetical protein